MRKKKKNSLNFCLGFKYSTYDKKLPILSLRGHPSR
uniref:Uncharacterized protein n=1 Tax=Rhizophora mucronata TaxID=61149 RepID=A0A2P2MX27_RHIMU